MCICKECAWSDNFCCSLRTKMIIFASWTLVHGLVCSGIYGNFAFRGDKCAFLGMRFMLAVIHIYAGILLFLAVLYNLSNAFMFGAILSFCFPLGVVYTGFLTYLMCSISNIFHSILMQIL